MTTKTIEPTILYFGTPVALVTTLNENGSPNIGPISSLWALGWTVVLGLGASGKTLSNIQRTRECVINLASEDLVHEVERLAPLTGCSTVPAHKSAAFRFEADKFTAAGLAPLGSTRVAPPRIAECPLQMEARVQNIYPIGVNDTRLKPGAFAVETEVICVHADERLVERNKYIRPAEWHPLIYNFRHYYGLGKCVGKSFRAEN